MDHKMARDDNSRLAAQLSETSIPWNSAGPPLDGGRTPATEPISSRRLLVAKGSYTTRHLVRAIRSEPTDFDLVRAPGLRARSGDVTLARVVEIGQHPAIECPDSRRALLFPGDEILVAYGNRYAPDQFEAEVPQDLGMTHLVAAGGVAGQMLTRHSKMAHPTVIEPLGLLSRAGTIVNLASYAPHRLRRGTLVPGASSPPVVSVIGTSMDSGKTTAAGALIRGLTAAGLHVSAGKITGTGAGRDAWLFADSGAVAVLDFTDFGHPSTYQLSFEELRALFIGIVGALGQAHPDVIILEVADGVLQAETARLLADPLFGDLVQAVVFTAVDAVGAFAGVRLLAELGIRVAAVSGVVTSSPLASREAETAASTPVVVTYELSEADVVTRVLSPYLGHLLSRDPTLVAP
jgi:hypothetical protein